MIHRTVGIFPQRSRNQGASAFRADLSRVEGQASSIARLAAAVENPPPVAAIALCGAVQWAAAAYQAALTAVVVYPDRISEALPTSRAAEWG